MYYILFLICILSRLLTSIYYIEDIDSLRFALGVADEYNVARFQPHFPGYPVFCFFVYVFYSLSDSLALSFSMVGGISTFIIIYYSVKMINLKTWSKQSLVFILIVFFNPMIWNLGNRYMADLMGLAVAVASIYYMVYRQDKKSQMLGLFLAGLVLGVRLSYFPLIAVPFVLILFKRKDIIYSLAFLFFGVAAWLIPFIFTQGLENILSVAIKHSIGHFNDYGGTIITESSLLARARSLLHTIWSDGLGGYWAGRAWTTSLIGVLTIFISKKLFANPRGILNSEVKALLVSGLVYLVWIFFFQNLIYKSRHVLPLVFIILILIGLTLKHQKSFTVHYILILLLGVLNYNIVSGHGSGTAIYQLRTSLANKEVDLVVSNPLINYYLRLTGIKSEYIDIEEFTTNNFKEKYNPEKNLKVIGNYTELFGKDYELLLDTTFYHNPYMNRMWSVIPMYSVKLAK